MLDFRYITEWTEAQQLADPESLGSIRLMTVILSS